IITNARIIFASASVLAMIMAMQRRAPWETAEVMRNSSVSPHGVHPSDPTSNTDTLAKPAQIASTLPRRGVKLAYVRGQRERTDETSLPDMQHL
ncbi:MAG: hypothetical protein ACPGFA_13640, partial [Pikeienuella sp.]